MRNLCNKQIIKSLFGVLVIAMSMNIAAARVVIGVGTGVVYPDYYPYSAPAYPAYYPDDYGYSDDYAPVTTGVWIGGWDVGGWGGGHNYHGGHGGGYHHH